MKDETSHFYDIVPVIDIKHFAELMLVSIAEQDKSNKSEIKRAFIPSDYKKRIESIMYQENNWKIKFSKLIDITEYYDNQINWEDNLSIELSHISKDTKYSWELDSVYIDYNKQEIETIDFNTKKINIILKEINHNILTKIQKLEMGEIKDLQVSNIFKEGKYKKIKRGVLCELPLNVLKNNITLSNIGPTIPIKLSFSGNVKTKTKTTTKNYGINNIVVEVIVVVEINEQITMPTSSKETTLTIEAPLVLKIIQGKVPEYYETDLNGNSVTSTIFSN